MGPFICTTCNNHDHATHMCRAPRQSSIMCIHCGSADHRSGNCPRNPWDNREQPHGTPDTLREQNPQSNTENSSEIPPLQEQPHMDILHSSNLNLMPKFWVIPYHTIQIMAKVIGILDTPKVMIITRISRGVPSNTHGLMKHTVSGTHPLHTHPLHH